MVWTTGCTLWRAGITDHAASPLPVCMERMVAVWRFVGQSQFTGMSLTQSIVQIEAAYDALFMHNMRARMTGQMNVKNSVRFADVPAKKPAQKKPQVCHCHLSPLSAQLCGA